MVYFISCFYSGLPVLCPTLRAWRLSATGYVAVLEPTPGRGGRQWLGSLPRHSAGVGIPHSYDRVTLPTAILAHIIPSPSSHGSAFARTGRKSRTHTKPKKTMHLGRPRWVPHRPHTKAHTYPTLVPCGAHMGPILVPPGLPQLGPRWGHATKPMWGPHGLPTWDPSGSHMGVLAGWLVVHGSAITGGINGCICLKSHAYA